MSRVLEWEILNRLSIFLVAIGDLVGNGNGNGNGIGINQLHYRRQQPSSHFRRVVALVVAMDLMLLMSI